MIETDLDEDVNQEMLTLYNIKKNCVVFRLFREIDRRCMISSARSIMLLCS